MLGKERDGAFAGQFGVGKVAVGPAVVVEAVAAVLVDVDRDLGMAVQMAAFTSSAGMCGSLAPRWTMTGALSSNLAMPTT